MEVTESGWPTSSVAPLALPDEAAHSAEERHDPAGFECLVSTPDGASPAFEERFDVWPDDARPTREESLACSPANADPTPWLTEFLPSCCRDHRRQGRASSPPACCMVLRSALSA
mmetsp:Transcript_49148/g.137634  ORF Transcript_49148/g.137634 Transcript_49148/m.137634 type:complete len:115 (+) Transcript_49148:1158-1502(+)